ncbi:cbb3-type cytochrome c oxidase N-terminal domain-containing protein [Flavobacterium sp. HSC-61S13]|uniref:cbb3-type cytochrome c oxidase N-terminal domain-containing protein n=1 Tax=Flavobacterium sp. HSC-61S13 TaxID=2910963 RepID=UPI00209FE099|nr:cbb3-type cytochrome c oxidase N-terminal domain-containing protein [Flavobacterium sp. HSC-61S13]MCP1996597.1 cytochrome c oxidase cbb3-type subunit 3 [Flavobacterium sp. HSC-61S13]
MKKYFPVYVRVPVLFALFFFALEYAIDSGDQPAFMTYPVVLVLLFLFLFALIAVEIVAAATDKVMSRLMTEEERAEQERLEALPFTESAFYKKLMKKLTRTKGIDEEGALLLDHDYDGIKELDNELPPWWVYLFYATIVFAVVYMARFHMFNGDNQTTEFEKEMLAAQTAVEEYKKTAPDMLTADQVVFLDDAADLAEGKKLFEVNCVVCHRADGGGGIGPNLTDDHWILGGGIKNVFNTVMEGGRDGKGMVAWKTSIKPSDIAKIASYVLTLHGTNPADAKAPEGEVWVDNTEAAPAATVASEVANDSVPATEPNPVE